MALDMISEHNVLTMKGGVYSSSVAELRADGYALLLVTFV